MHPEKERPSTAAAVLPHHSVAQDDRIQPYVAHRVMVADPHTGVPLRFRRFADEDALGFGVRLHRVPFPVPEHVVMSHLRGGIGRVSEGDKNYRTAEGTPGWHTSSKGGRDYADLDLQPGRVFVVGRTSKFSRPRTSSGGRQASAVPSRRRDAPTHAETAGPLRGFGVPSNPHTVHRYGGPMGSVAAPGSGEPVTIRVGPTTDGRAMWRK